MSFIISDFDFEWKKILKQIKENKTVSDSNYTPDYANQNIENLKSRRKSLKNKIYKLNSKIKKAKTKKSIKDSKKEIKAINKDIKSIDRDIYIYQESINRKIDKTNLDRIYNVAKVGRESKDKLKTVDNRIKYLKNKQKKLTDKISKIGIQAELESLELNRINLKSIVNQRKNDLLFIIDKENFPVRIVGLAKSYYADAKSITALGMLRKDYEIFSKYSNSDKKVLYSSKQQNAWDTQRDRIANNIEALELGIEPTDYPVRVKINSMVIVLS